MAYIPNSGSVVAFQSDPTKLQVTASIVNFPLTQNVSGSVVAIQGTSPWVVAPNNSSVISVPVGSVISYVQNSVATVIIGGSIAASFTPPANQSVSGTVQVDVRASVATVIIGGSIAATFTPPANQSVSGTVQTDVRASVAVVIIGGSVATATTNSSVMLLNSTNVIGSVATLQGTNPWITANTQTGTVVTSIAGLLENTIQASTTGLPIFFKSNMSTSVMSVVSPATPLPASVQGTVTVLQGTTPWLTNQGGSVIAVVQNSSLIAINAGSVFTVSLGSIITVNQSSSVIAVATGSVVAIPAGSVITVFSQGPSIVGTYKEPVVVTSVTGLAMMFKTNVSTSTMGVVSSTNPVPVSGAVSQSGTWTASVIGNVSVLGTVPVTQSSMWLVSVLGGYAEDAASAGGDPGLFVLGVRNDTVASLVSANGDYGGLANDSAGRLIFKPFASEDATIISYTGSVVSGSVTLIQASAIGKKSYITDIAVSNTGAATTLVTFQGGDTSIVGYTIAPSGGGSNLPGLAIPWKTNASQDLAFKASPSTSILYLTIKGYQAP